MQNNRDLLWENEVNANRLLATAMLGAAAVFALIFALIDTGVFYVYRWDGTVNRLVMLLVEIALVSGYCVSRKLNYENKRLKVILMGDVIFSFAVMIMIFTEAASILMVVPIILSSRYFSKNYTMWVSALSIIVFFAATILGALYGDYDVNNLQLTPHTVIDMGNESWISDVIENGGIIVDDKLMVRNVLLYAYVPNLLLTLLCVLISMTISEQGRRMVLEQKELAEHSAMVETELALAADIQMGTLPKAFPDRKEFEIHAYMNPAKEVGGDLYDFFPVDDDHFAVVIADVSGKGMSAALFMMTAKTLIKNQTEQGLQDPGEIFTRVNQKLMEINTTYTFVTAWLGILDIRSGEMRYVDAGHECPAVRKSGDLFKILKDIHCPPLAALSRTVFKSGGFRMEPGDTLYLYTDGVAEANITIDDMFGKERMLDALNKDPDAHTEIIDNNVISAIDEFVKGAPQFDDTTMLCLKYYGDTEEKSRS